MEALDTEAQLKAEIKKWSARLADALITARPVGEQGMQIMTNVRAYHADAAHFLQRNDYVRSFEALIWAWAFLQIGQDLGLIAS